MNKATAPPKKRKTENSVAISRSDRDRALEKTRKLVDSIFTQWILGAEDVKDATVWAIATKDNRAVHDAFVANVDEILDEDTRHVSDERVKEAREAFKRLRDSMIELDNAAETFCELLGGFEHSLERLAEIK